MAAVTDCLIVGGGVVGLSLAWRLAQRGLAVTLLDRGPLASEASWAGAGILPPAELSTAIHPYDILRGISIAEHPRWAAELKELTGIDSEYSVCGAIYLARQAGEAAALSAWSHTLLEEKITVSRLDSTALAEAEPALAHIAGVRSAYLLPQEAQLRNPRHLQALIAACRKAGVNLVPNAPALDFEISGDKLTSVVTPDGKICADNFCLCTGAWSAILAQKLRLEMGVVPIRGQMLLYKTEHPLCKRVINEGPRYIVPRRDGHLLIGSTEEEAGFDKSTTSATLADLQSFAFSLFPSLEKATLVKHWSGLRPGSFDSMPYLGNLPGLCNAFVAAGHFRSGLYLSPGTALAMTALICREPCPVDLSPFRLGR